MMTSMTRDKPDLDLSSYGVSYKAEVAVVKAKDG